MSCRTHGAPPFTVTVIHGGPGALGDMADAARELARVSGHGVVEPLCGAVTVDGQVEEVRRAIHGTAAGPPVIIGHSWGAWLALLFAATHADAAAKIILVGAGPLEERCSAEIMDIRMSRLSPDERAEVQALLDGSEEWDDAAISRFGTLIGRADAFDQIETGPEDTDFRPGVFSAVWPEAAEIRRSGRLLDAAGRVRCPVTVIHGDYDPHPAGGVRVPLENVSCDCTFHLLERCGHYPWRERWARDEFYRILRCETTL